MLLDSFEHAKEDVHARALAEARVEASASSKRRARRSPPTALLDDEEREGDRRAACAALEQLLHGTDHRAIKQAIDALNRATEDFAARRMDQGIRRALAGQEDRQPLMPKIKVLPQATLSARRAPRSRPRPASRSATRCSSITSTSSTPARSRRACTTCHVIVREGFDSLEPAEEKEEDMLDKAWGLEATSRLSCQAKVADEDLVIEIPKYTINYEREGGGKKP